ncbi:MAG: TIGR04552 family protein [Acidobacteria bacterium]|nr:TIGR04552 family protein [Acidobacteriota bacterium]MCB9397297.1 TIGR04552 family protein [Acidobacteriota bacterium]
MFFETEDFTLSPYAERSESRQEPFFLNWSQMDGILTGKSAVDLTRLQIRTRDQALQFAIEYGINPMVPDHQKRAWQAHAEALNFLQEYILSAEEYALCPPEVKAPRHILDLVVMASNYLNTSKVHQMFACSVLKVMHILFHIDFDLKLRFFDQIRSQVFTGFERVMIDKGQRKYLQDDVQSIPLVRYSRKRNKDRPSMVLKLLHKSQTVAADIYDHLGMRLVFNTKFECLLALRLLHRNHLISYTNLKPFRSRNTLIDLRAAHEVYKRYRDQLEISRRYPTQLLQKMDRELAHTSRSSEQWDNPFTATEYQAIQVTVRKMIHVNNPYLQDWTRLIHELNHIPGKEAEHLRSRLVSEIGTPEIPFYFDYEIQLQDKESYKSTIIGPASHKAYKERQRLAARKRVLGPELRRYFQSVLGPREEG